MRMYLIGKVREEQKRKSDGTVEFKNSQYVVCDLDAKCALKLVTKEQVYNVLKMGVKIENAKIFGKNIVGIKYSLDRLSSVDRYADGTFRIKSNGILVLCPMGSGHLCCILSRRTGKYEFKVLADNIIAKYYTGNSIINVDENGNIAEVEKVLNNDRMAKLNSEVGNEDVVWTIKDFKDYMVAHGYTFSISKGSYYSSKDELELRDVDPRCKIIHIPYGVNRFYYEIQKYEDKYIDKLIISPTVDNIQQTDASSVKLNSLFSDIQPAEVNGYKLTERWFNENRNNIVNVNSVSFQHGNVRAKQSVNDIQRCELFYMHIKSLRAPNVLTVEDSFSNCIIDEISDTYINRIKTSFNKSILGNAIKNIAYNIASMSFDCLDIGDYEIPEKTTEINHSFYYTNIKNLTVSSESQESKLDSIHLSFVGSDIQSLDLTPASNLEILSGFKDCFNLSEMYIGMLNSNEIKLEISDGTYSKTGNSTHVISPTYLKYIYSDTELRLLVKKDTASDLIVELGPNIRDLSYSFTNKLQNGIKLRTSGIPRRISIHELNRLMSIADMNNIDLTSSYETPEDICGIYNTYTIDRKKEKIDKLYGKLLNTIWFKSINKITDNRFNSCNITTLIINKNIESIGSNVFDGAEIGTLIIHDDIKILDDKTFNLKSKEITNVYITRRCPAYQILTSKKLESKYKVIVVDSFEDALAHVLGKEDEDKTDLLRKQLFLEDRFKPLLALQSADDIDDQINLYSQLDSYRFIEQVEVDKVGNCSLQVNSFRQLRDKIEDLMECVKIAGEKCEYSFDEDLDYSQLPENTKVFNNLFGFIKKVLKTDDLLLNDKVIELLTNGNNKQDYISFVVSDESKQRYIYVDAHKQILPVCIVVRTDNNNGAIEVRVNVIMVIVDNEIVYIAPFYNRHATNPNSETVSIFDFATFASPGNIYSKYGGAYVSQLANRIHAYFDVANQFRINDRLFGRNIGEVTFKGKNIIALSDMVNHKQSWDRLFELINSSLICIGVYDDGNKHYKGLLFDIVSNKVIVVNTSSIRETYYPTIYTDSTVVIAETLDLDVALGKYRNNIRICTTNELDTSARSLLRLASLDQQIHRIVGYPDGKYTETLNNNNIKLGKSIYNYLESNTDDKDNFEIIDIFFENSDYFIEDPEVNWTKLKNYICNDVPLARKKESDGTVIDYIKCELYTSGSSRVSYDVKKYANSRLVIKKISKEGSSKVRRLIKIALVNNPNKIIEVYKKLGEVYSGTLTEEKKREILKNAYVENRAISSIDTRYKTLLSKYASSVKLNEIAKYYGIEVSSTYFELRADTYTGCYFLSISMVGIALVDAEAVSENEFTSKFSTVASVDRESRGKVYVNNALSINLFRFSNYKNAVKIWDKYIDNITPVLREEWRTTAFSDGISSDDFKIAALFILLESLGINDSTYGNADSKLCDYYKRAYFIYKLRERIISGLPIGFPVAVSAEQNYILSLVDRQPKLNA